MGPNFGSLKIGFLFSIFLTQFFRVFPIESAEMRHVFSLTVLLVAFVCHQTSARTCRENWDNHCTAHQQCCSTNCWRGRPDWKYGVCKPMQELDEQGGNGNDNGNSVIGEPATNEGYSARSCRKDWDNHCTGHQQCCSTNCWRGRPDWKYGVCKPLEEGGEESNGGSDGSETGEPSTGGEGVARGCRKDMDNHCTKHQQCCSTNCWRGRPDWKYGVCKPLEEVSEQGDGGNDNISVTVGPVDESSSSETSSDTSSEDSSDTSSETSSEDSAGLTTVRPFE